jgi:hypothetical protein
MILFRDCLFLGVRLGGLGAGGHRWRRTSFFASATHADGWLPGRFRMGCLGSCRCCMLYAWLDMTTTIMVAISTATVGSREEALRCDGLTLPCAALLKHMVANSLTHTHPEPNHRQTLVRLKHLFPLLGQNRNRRRTQISCPLTHPHPTRRRPLLLALARIDRVS